MTRREWLASALASLPSTPKGTILVHEHVMVDFIGADRIRPGRYDPEEVFGVAKIRLEEVRALGCRRLQECTPNYLGRDARLMQRLADATGVEIWINTGLYAAANHKFLPQFARTETAAQLARRWIEEWRTGVDGVKPRFVKIGVNRGPLPELDRKVVEAAALTARETGLTVAAHTGDGAAALQELEIFDTAGAPLDKFVWVHAQNEKDHAIHEQVARAGAWVEFDGIREATAAWHRQCVGFMASRQLLGRTLISQDSGWYRVGEPGGGDYRSYTFIYTGFVPQLDPATVRTLLVENPVKAFGA